MASKEELQRLRVRMSHVLASPKCAYIRFVLGPIQIQSFMFNYIAQAILDDAVHLIIGDPDRGQSYDHRNDTIYYDDLGPNDDAIVHESTHAIIDATNPGLGVSVAIGEAAAYLAEAIFAINDDNRFGTILDPHLATVCHMIAVEAVAYNDKNPGGVYQVSPQQILWMQSKMDSTRQSMDTVWVQNGLEQYIKKYG
jgi:hypothetical protein